MLWLLAALGALVVQARLTAPGGPCAPAPSTAPAPAAAPRVVAEGRLVAYPDAEVVVGTDVAGTIERLRVREKASVRRGQVLVELKSDDLRAELAEARARIAEEQAQLRLAATELERAERLVADGVSPLQDLDRRRSERDAREARLETARASTQRLEALIGKTRIASPIDGVVVLRHADQGETVDRGAPLITVANLIYNHFALTDQYITTIGNTTGLGLTLVKRYVDFLNGELNITSTIGKGTTFTLTIPVEEISIIEEQISSLPKPDFTNKVLVVEDDYATSKLLSNYLHKWGYEPTIVNSAEQTLKVIQKEQFLAILMDIVLPNSNGLQLLQRIREINSAKSTPVIICSVEAEQQKAFLMGAVEYFVKPINYKYLIEVLTNYRLRKDSNILLVDDDIPSLRCITKFHSIIGPNGNLICPIS